MPKTIRFHLDEHASNALANGLRRLGIDVSTAASAGLLGPDDATHLAFAQAQGRVLFTHDHDYLRLHDAGVPHAGIAYGQQRKRSLGDILQGLAAIWEILDPKDMHNRLEYL